MSNETGYDLAQALQLKKESITPCHPLVEALPMHRPSYQVSPSLVIGSSLRLQSPRLSRNYSNDASTAAFSPPYR